MSLTAPERETIVRFDDTGAAANVWTAQPTVITRLKRTPSAVLLGEGRFETTAWAEFEIPQDLVFFLAAEQADLLRKAEARASRSAKAKERWSQMSASERAERLERMRGA